MENIPSLPCFNRNTTSVRKIQNLIKKQAISALPDTEVTGTAKVAGDIDVKGFAKFTQGTEKIGVEKGHRDYIGYRVRKGCRS